MRIDEEYLVKLGELAQQAGLPVLDLSRAYHGVTNRREVAVAPGDAHPNAEGHRRLADELYRQMLAMPSWRAVFGVDQPTAAALVKSRGVSDTAVDITPVRKSSSQE
jgi:hypothetical protein